LKLALICTEKLPVPPIAGGAIQLYIEGILPYLSKAYDITVFSIQHPGLPEEEIRDGVRYSRLPAKSAAEYVKNLKINLNRNFDLIHVFNRPRWVLMLGRELPRVKFSLSLHNEMFHTEKISDNEALECVDRVEFINTVSDFISNGVKKRVPAAEKKLRVVYSGADIEKYKPNWTNEGIQNKIRLKEKYNLKGYKIILFIGRLSVKKGIHVMMQAVSKVMEQDPDVALVIVGSKWYGKNETDDYSRSLENLAKSMRGPIIFTGFLPPSIIPDYYNLGDIFICASQWNEPLARVHYEAMAAGLPIITTNRGGNAEVIENFISGLIIDDYNNPEEFKKNINYLLLNPQKAEKMGIRGRMLVEEKYNWKRVAEEVFKPVCSNIIDTPVIINEEVHEEVAEREQIDIIEQQKEAFFEFDFS